MSGSRTLVQFLSIALLFLWGGVLLYFYATGRLVHYLPQDGLFHSLVLVAGVGLAILGLFNLLTANSEAATCATGTGGCCGGHDQDHKHDHAPKHEDMEAAESLAPHGHGILEDSSWTGRLVALLILAAPLTWAAFSTPDSYSANGLKNKGLYEKNTATATNAGKFSLRTDTAPATPATKLPEPAAKAAPTVASAPPAATTPKPRTNTPIPLATPSVVKPQEVTATAAAAATPGAASTQSYGKFSLADLEKQVPRSKAGNFILEVPEIYYTAGDAEVQGVIAGQSVETTAQVLPEKVNNPDGHRLRIFRLLVQCCAADARPYSVPVDFGKKAPEFKDMTWVKVTGKMAFRKEGNQTVPIIESATIEPAAAPDNQMISQ